VYHTRIDNAGPVFSVQPGDVTVSLRPGAFGATITANDLCYGAVNVSYTQTSTQGSDATQANFYNYTITRKWKQQMVVTIIVRTHSYITVQDITNPTAKCKSIQVYLTPAGTVTITASQVDDGSFDNCSPVSLGISPASFTVANVGPNTVTLTVTDVSGNSASCQSTVTVIDNTPPNAICQPAIVTLVNGSATITGADIDNGSNDASGISSLQASKTSFSCADIGANTVVLTVTDNNNNVATCTTTVTVLGEVPTCSITSTPNGVVYTGGVSTNLYLGYGPQSTTLQVSTPAIGAPYTYSWSPVSGTGQRFRQCRGVYTSGRRHLYFYSNGHQLNGDVPQPAVSAFVYSI
jgi:hypothetical protein